MPAVYNTYAGVEGQWYRPGQLDSFAGLVNLGVWKSLGSPVVGIAALGLEGYVGARSSNPSDGGADLDGGGRAYFKVPSLYFGLGVDYNIKDTAASFMLQLSLPMRRGGILGNGSTLDIRYLPGYHNTLSVGLSFPLPARNLGKTRPPHDAVRLESRKPYRVAEVDLDPRLDDPLTGVRERAHWITRLSQPLVDKSDADPHRALAPYMATLVTHMDSTDALFPEGHTLNEEIRVYHAELDRAFSIAVDGTPFATGHSSATGRKASAAARGILLNEVLLRYNSLLGERKTNDGLSAPFAVAKTAFGAWLTSENDVSPFQARQAFLVFHTLCDIVDENRMTLRKQWGDTRFVWLPLQYALKPEDHDTQEEINAIIEGAAQERFSPGNRVWYVMNEEFQFEIARSVRKAKEYHVLWIHDIRGLNGNGNPDAIAYQHTVNYLEALIEHARAYDRTGSMPMYMIFLDQHYFELNKSRMWLRVLQEPMDEMANLPGDYREWEDHLRSLQRDLRAAVDSSTALHVARSQFGDKWLKNLVKVHVNITNPADPSFYSFHSVGIIPIPDNMMRDHRKIAFYDVTEEDPYLGRAMFTGMGIGEHYVGANWEDRAVMIEGPEALETKTAARELLLNQGFTESEIPAPLRARPFGYDYTSQVREFLAGGAEAFDDEAAVLQLHNQTGFRPKPINPVKAVLYSLMPPGSVLKVPDSLWQSYIYASLLSGSALRGCRVLVIAPTAGSAPSAGTPQLVRANGMLARLLVVANALDSYIAREGGLLKVGLYAPKVGVGDLAGRFAQAVATSVPWQKKIYPDRPEFLAVAENAGAQLDSLGYAVRYLHEEDTLISPKMHLKANMFASVNAWDRIAARPEWAGILKEYITYLAELGSTSGDSHPDVTRLPDALRQQTARMVTNLLADTPAQERERMVLYLTVGSVNMDYHSMLMDGEAMITMAGWRSLVGMLDFMLLTGLCQWVETVDDLNALLPPGSGMQRTMAGLMKLIL